MLPIKNSLEVVIPVYNEDDGIDELISRLFKLREKMLNQVEMNFIFVDDGSNDRSAEILLNYAVKMPFIKIINFSRNFGHQMAVTAGLDYAKADFVAILDADLQDPPELIEEMYAKIQEGFDVIYGKRLDRKGETIFKRWTAKIFYNLINRLCDVTIPADAGDFRLVNIRVLKVLKQMRERHRFIRGMIPWFGFKSYPISYNRDERFAGVTKYPLKKMIKFAKDAIFSFSDTPLKIANFVGFTIVGVGIVGSIVELYLRLMTTLTIPGITAVILTVVILGGIQIIMLGIIGEYVGRIFEQSKGRPLYVVAKTENISNQQDA